MIRSSSIKRSFFTKETSFRRTNCSVLPVLRRRMGGMFTKARRIFPPRLRVWYDERMAISILNRNPMISRRTTWDDIENRAILQDQRRRNGTGKTTRFLRRLFQDNVSTLRKGIDRTISRFSGQQFFTETMVSDLDDYINTNFATSRPYRLNTLYAEREVHSVAESSYNANLRKPLPEAFTRGTSSYIATGEFTKSMVRFKIWNINRINETINIINSDVNDGVATSPNGNDARWPFT